MIVFSKLLADNATVWEALRAKESHQNRSDLVRFSSESSPVVMWNLTRACNLKCKHCYIDAASPHPDEWSLEEGLAFIDELAKMHVPILILTGGEPLMSPHIFECARYAKSRGLRTALSTNGTLITPDVALKLKESGIQYVGVSIDSVSPKKHDAFRGVDGAFERALSGLRTARDTGMHTGLRVTLTKYNFAELPALIELCLEERIPRFCMYHLVPTGRGKNIAKWDITKHQRRWVLDVLYERAKELKDKPIEILSTDSPMDGAYILERLKHDDPKRFEEAKGLLSAAGGCSMGVKVANVDFLGNLSPCHFAPQVKLGNVRTTPFTELWKEHPCEALRMLRQKSTYISGKCGRCEYVDVCGGCRQKAYVYTGDLLGEDPTCIYDPDTKTLVSPDSAVECETECEVEPQI
ncbi:MAG: radical SAM protein [Methermicoccaceae archaeon]